MVQGPIYDIDRDHHFQQLMVHAQELKNLRGPVYNVEKDHHFRNLIMNAYELKQLMGPVYSEGGGTHKYMPQKPISDHEMQINGPVFKGVESHNLYNPAMEHKPKADVPMTGPVLPVESSNHYVPMEEPKNEWERVMAPPTYRGINIERHNQVCRT